VKRADRLIVLEIIAVILIALVVASLIVERL
jgi:hypothetical protein